MFLLLQLLMNLSLSARKFLQLYSEFIFNEVSTEAVNDCLFDSKRLTVTF